MAIQVDKATIIACSVFGSLGVLSAILGFSAEGTKLTPYTILVYGDQCIYPHNPALGLGVSAAIFLLAAQIIFSVVGSCCGCCNRSRSIPWERRRIIGIVCAVVSWIAAVIAWALLIQGAAWNANVVRTNAPDCYYLKDGIFAGAGVLTLAATALGVISLIMLQRQPPEPSVGGTPTSAGEKPPSIEVPPAAPHPQGGHEHATDQNLPAIAQGNNGSHGPNDTPGNVPAGSTTIRNELIRAAIRFFEKALEHVCFSKDNHILPATQAEVISIPMVTDPTEGDVVGTTSDSGNTPVV